MAEIKQLSREVADQISAGEVIERPASVVKELVENAIDAGSDKILIEVDNGGKDKIRVKDNGSGIRGKKLELAFSRYATSKIENINDIYSLRTLGFRGEALASIASVSKIEVLSRFQDEMNGNKIIIKGSKVIKKEPAGCPQGTDITVRDLFYNTPARFKYMKTTNTEFGHISNTVCNEALGYPQIQFTLKHNNKQVLQTPGTGNLKDSVYAIYGGELTSKLIPVDFKDEYIQVRGFITRPDFYRSSRIYEKFFVNQRIVHNSNLNRAVEAGYKNFLPSGKYPVVFLFIKLNPILVDVNVHPAKKEIKFSRNQVIREVIKNGIKDKLVSIDTSPKIKRQKKDSKNRKEKVKEKKLQFGKKDESSESKKTREEIEKNRQNVDNADNVYKTTEERKTDSKRPVSEVRENHTEEQEEAVPVTKVLGQIHNTYIIAEIEDGFYIIDQHAAHERILYEQLMQEYENKKIVSQQLLTPITLELTPTEIEIVNKYKSHLENSGIKLEEFGGNSFIVRELPVLLKNKSGKSIVKDMIDNLVDSGKTMKQSEIMEEIITYMSCRGAVKAGEHLDNRELKKMISGLFQSANPYRCPHGRPAIIHFSADELAKEVERK